MKDKVMLTKSQFRQLQIASGLSSIQIFKRTGILPQSLMVLLNMGDSEGLDPAKMVSEGTLRRVLNLIGIDNEVPQLKKNSVIEWSCADDKNTAKWKVAVKSLHDKLSMTNAVLGVVTCPHSLFGKRKMTLFLYVTTSEGEARIAITQADKGIKKFIEELFNVVPVRVEQARSASDFKLTEDLIANGVYRVTQFNLVISGKKGKYSWDHVLAAAQEFNYGAEDVINLIVDHAEGRLSATVIVQDNSVAEKHLSVVNA